MPNDSLLRPAETRLSLAAWALSQRYWRFVVIAMLGLLHLVVLRGVSDDGARALLFAHLGLLLLWQPFLRGEQKVTPAQALTIALLAACMVLWLNWWLLAAWTVVLAGLVGGKVFLHQARWQRQFYLLMFVYLLALLVVIVLPQIAPRNEVGAEIRAAAAWGLPSLFVLMALTPAQADPPETPQVIDYFYSVFVMLVLGVVILGSFALMTLGRTGYLQAFIYVVFGLAGFLLAVGLAWNPRTGYAGLNVFVSRYLFSIGLPIEDWLEFLAELSQAETRPDRFLGEAVAGLVRMPSVQGATWKARGEQGEAGTRSPHAVEFAIRELSLTVYSRYRTSPALHGHLRLLGRLLGEFYYAKLREEELRRGSYLQAVHETGARVTHDVKNLLQSLNVLCAVAAREDADAPEAQALLRRQLPAVTQRLAATLDKLQRPGMEQDARVPAAEWWDTLQRQYLNRGVQFSQANLAPQSELPRALFDSVADNLLQNALAKRAGQRGIVVRAELSGGEMPALRVSDTGSAVPSDVERLLLRAPVPSDSGLGIGLFQAARQARAAGYELRLESNRDGDVCFALSRATT